MFFIIDEKNKICYGWSAKSGCTHVKNILNFLIYNIHVLKNEDEFKDPKWLQQIPLIEKDGEKKIDISYKIIIVSRNPFERLVSGFKYKRKSMGKTFNHIKPFSFEFLVNELFNNGIADSKYPNGKINRHHFTQQFSEAWTPLIDTLNPNIFKIMDIKNIDYSFLENIYKKKIPYEFIQYKGEQNVSSNTLLKPYTGKNAYKLHIDKILEYDVKPHQLYNKNLYTKVKQFYEKDLILFKTYGLDYDILF